MQKIDTSSAENSENASIDASKTLNVRKISEIFEKVARELEPLDPNKDIEKRLVACTLATTPMTGEEKKYFTIAIGKIDLILKGKRPISEELRDVLNTSRTYMRSRMYETKELPKEDIMTTTGNAVHALMDDALLN